MGVDVARLRALRDELSDEAERLRLRIERVLDVAAGRSEGLEETVRRAVGFIKSVRTSLGWRYYGRSRDTDTSVTSWMILGLEAAGVVEAVATDSRGRQKPVRVHPVRDSHVTSMVVD